MPVQTYHSKRVYSSVFDLERRLPDGYLPSSKDHLFNALVLLALTFREIREDFGAQASTIIKLDKAYSELVYFRALHGEHLDESVITKYGRIVSHANEFTS